MSEITVYDKAKYHYEGDFPSDLDQYQAHVHIGFFLGWICDHGMLSGQMNEDFPEEIGDFKQRKITGPKLLELCGGAFASDMLNEAGNEFAGQYFEGIYLDDYFEILGQDLPNLYHVQDTWENYEQLVKRIDQRYQEYKDGILPSE